MKKLLAIVVLGLLFSSKVFAKDIYLTCENNYVHQDKMKMQTQRDFILDTKKLVLHQIRYTGYSTFNGKKWKRDEKFPILDNKGENFYPNYKSSDTNYSFGRSLSITDRKSALEIEKLNKNNKTKRRYTLIYINKFNLEMIIEDFNYEGFGTDKVNTKKLFSYSTVYKCKKLNKKI